MISVFGSKVGSEELKEIKTSLDNQWLGMGAKVNKLEKILSGYIGNPDFVLVDSGSNALHVAIEALELPERSEIILPAVTWISCATAIELAGHTPVFVDVDYRTLNIDLNSLYRSISNKTVAIMVVHYAGFPSEIHDFGLPVISDCAHAIDTFIGGRHIGNVYDISVFSFDGVKNIAAGELGGVTSIDPKYTDNVRNLRYCGIKKSGYESRTDKNRWWEYEIKKPFPKMLPNDITASIGIAQFKKLDSLQVRRKEIWGIYQQQLKDIDWLICPPDVSITDRHSYFTYFIKVINGERDRLAKYLLDKSIYTTVRYHPLHLIDRYNGGHSLPVAEKLNEELLNIPIHPNLSDRELEYIIQTIKDFK